MAARGFRCLASVRPAAGSTQQARQSFLTSALGMKNFASIGSDELVCYAKIPSHRSTPIFSQKAGRSVNSVTLHAEHPLVPHKQWMYLRTTAFANVHQTAPFLVRY